MFVDQGGRSSFSHPLIDAVPLTAYALALVVRPGCLLLLAACSVRPPLVNIPLSFSPCTVPVHAAAAVSAGDEPGCHHCV